MIYRFSKNTPFSASAIVLLCLCFQLSSCSIDPKPNILILFLDDFGYSDLAANQPANAAYAPQHTPNMNAFASEAISFSRHYTESTCSPSRAALLSGRYPARFGFTSDGRGLPPEITTLPEALLTANYKTHFTGKWHTGDTTELAFPQNQGFETWFGFINQWMTGLKYDPSVNNYQSPTYLDPWLQDESGVKQQYQGQLTDLLTDNAVSFIESSGSETRPWFLQVSFYAPHEPVEAASRYRAQYPDTAEGAYRALVHQLDDSVGTLLEALKNSGQAENTVVVLVSDNGGTARRFPSNRPFWGEKASYTEGGVRTPLMIRWPDGSLANSTYPYPVSLMDIYPTLLTYAGIDYETEKLDGVNLLEHLGQNSEIERALFWELYFFDRYTYSVLDKSHRWRYSSFVDDNPALFDLQTDPTGADNVRANNPEIVNELQADYRAWHRSIHRLDTSFESVATNGKGILRGDSFQRSPGFGGYTFAIGVTPDVITSSVDELGPDRIEETIASQSNLLLLSYANGLLTTSIQDAKLSAPIPADGKCHSVIVTAQFNARISALTNDSPIRSPIELIVDGKIVDARLDGRELPKQADFSAPTYIGYRPGMPEESEFNGQLSPAVLYNHHVVIDPQEGQFGITELDNEVCPK